MEDKMADIVLGLELDTRDIRLAIVKRDKKPRVLETAVIKAPDGCLADGEIVFADGVSQAIKDYLKEVAYKPDALAVSLNSPNVITRKLNMPKMNAQETALAVTAEILNIFPSIKETHTIAHKQTGLTTGSPQHGGGGRGSSRGSAGSGSIGSGSGSGGSGSGAGASRRSGDTLVSVFVAICPNVLIESCETLSVDIGIPLKYIDVNPNTLNKAAATYLGLNKSTAGLVVDIGYSSSIINVVVNGDVVISRYVASGISSIGKIGAGADDDASVFAVALSDIEEQIRQTIDFTEYDMPHDKLTFLSIAGEGYGTPGIGKYLSNRFNLDFLELKPISEAEGIKDFVVVAPAVGAVLRDARQGGDINFITTAAEEQSRQKRGKAFNKYTAALTIAVAIFAIAVILAAFFHIKNQSDQREIQGIIERIESNAQVSQLERDIAADQSKLALIGALIDEVESSSISVSDMLITLSGMTPDDLFVSTLNALNENETVLIGKSKDYNSISWFALKLRESGEFESVQINSVVSNKTAAGDVIDYSYTITLKKQG
jgi:Tfp pilus assembly PilM family ATPase